MVEAPPSGIDFDRPPVSEVVCGVRFSPLLEMTAAQLGEFCLSVQRQLPEVTSGRLAAPVPSEMLRRAIPPLPRTIATASDGSEAIQLQQNQFLYNWAKSPKGGSYPHFERIFANFLDYLDRFQRFVASAKLGELRLESYVLNYVNHIDAQQGWKGAIDSGRFVPALAGLQHANIRDFHWHPTYILDDGIGELDVVAANSTRTVDSAKVLRLELEVSYEFPKDGKPLSLDDWFPKARRHVGTMFLDLTDREAQEKIWGRRS
jgi:uncharacterized protein (TIGR04255 family)